jgi:hypothetical protein
MDSDNINNLNDDEDSQKQDSFLKTDHLFLISKLDRMKNLLDYEITALKNDILR